MLQMCIYCCDLRITTAYLSDRNGTQSTNDTLVGRIDLNLIGRGAWFKDIPTGRFVKKSIYCCHPETFENVFDIVNDVQPIVNDARRSVVNEVESSRHRLVVKV